MTEYKEWLDLSVEEKEDLRYRWTIEEIMTILKALEEGKPLPVEKFPLTKEESMYPSAMIKNYDLRGIIFPQDDFIEILFQRVVDLKGIDLKFAHLEGAIFGIAHLEGADLKFAHLEGADLNYAHLEGAHLRDAHLEETDLCGTHLEGADLWCAHLEGADLKFAHLEGADLNYAHLEGADLSAAIFEDTHLHRPQLEKTIGYRDIEWVNCFVGKDLVTYRKLKELYKREGKDELVPEFHYMENCVKTRMLQWQRPFQAIQRFLRLIFLEWTYGYGSRPTWLLRAFGVVTISFAILFFSFTPNTSDPNQSFDIKLQDPDSDSLFVHLSSLPIEIRIGECFLFSLLSFFRFGYDVVALDKVLSFLHLKPVEYTPIGWARIFTGLEGLIGLYLLSLFVYGLLRRR
jgi:hypothetical protein